MEGDCYHLPSFYIIAHFNPLPPHGGRPGNVSQYHRCRGISIHSLRMEGDQIVLYYFVHPYISIHSLRMEGDPVGIPEKQKCNISIHSLRMEGDVFIISFSLSLNVFQSTPSAWRETFCGLPSVLDLNFISIHSLRMEGDEKTQAQINSDFIFQSTPSAWRETFL